MPTEKNTLGFKSEILTIICKFEIKCQAKVRSEKRELVMRLKK